MIMIIYDNVYIWPELCDRWIESSTQFTDRYKTVLIYVD